MTLRSSDIATSAAKKKNLTSLPFWAYRGIVSRVDSQNGLHQGDIQEIDSTRNECIYHAQTKRERYDVMRVHVPGLVAGFFFSEAYPSNKIISSKTAL